LPLTGIILILFLLFLFLPFLFFLPLRMILSLFLKGITVSAQFSPSLKISVSALFLIFFYSACFLVFYAPRKKSITIMLSTAISISLLCGIVISSMKIHKPDRLYFFSFGKPSLVFIMDNRSVAFLADHYKKQEIADILIPLLRAEKAARIAGLFYTDISYNHSGTLNPLLENTEILRVYEHPDILQSFSFPHMNAYFYQVMPGVFEFLSGDRSLHLEGLTVEILGTEKNTFSYIIRRGRASILVAPYIGEILAERVKNRKFTVAFIGDIKKTSGVMRNINRTDYLYLIIPSDYKKFGILPEPRIKTFFLKTGSVEMILDKSPFSISYLYE